ncbi:MAG: hypothetical protein NVSMB46_00200 [Candidatus Saccharimonadales bacterium]
MAESLPPNPGIIDPTLTAGNSIATSELKVRFSSFEEAQSAEKQFSDIFINGAINDQLKVGNEQVGIKGYLDKVEATDKDNDIIANPEAIAGLYLSTTEMVARNLKILVGRSPDESKTTERRAVIKDAKDGFIAGLHDQAIDTADQIVDWCKGSTKQFPARAMEYRGLKIDGSDPLDAENNSATDFRPNIKIQRQLGGTFIMGYSDTRVKEKLAKQDQEISRRIYLNPDPETAPQVFEQVLQAANEAGLSIQLKIFQRTPEFAEAHLARSKGHAKDGFRGDGIVIYSGESQAEDVLGMVLALAKDKPEAFIGRQTSKIPQSVAEGIAIGDEPTQTKGYSLTSHRVEMFSYAAEYVRKSGKTGQEAAQLFKNRVIAAAKANHTNPRNIAFNVSTRSEVSSAVNENGGDDNQKEQITTVKPAEEFISKQEFNIDESTPNKIFESQIQQFVRSLHERAKSEKRDLNPAEVQQIRSLVDVVQQRRGVAPQESLEPTSVQDEKTQVDDEVVKYMKDNNIDITTAGRRYEAQVQQFVQSLHERASRDGRELSPKEIKQIKTAVETVNDLRGFASRVV